MAERARARPRAIATATLLGVLAFAEPVVAQQAPWGQPITRIEIQTPADDLRDMAAAAIVQRIGEPYSVEAVRASLQNLLALGTIEDVDVLAASEPSGLRLIFRLVPAVVVRRLAFTGDRPWSSGRMRRALALRDDAPVDAAVAAQLAARLQRALSDDGYQLATVTPRLEVDRARRTATLTLRVESGQRTRLGVVEITGALGVPRLVAENVLDLRTGDWYRPGDLEAAVDRLQRTLVQRHRFFAAVRVGQQALDLRAGAMDVAIRVAAGPRVALDIRGLETPEHELHDRLAVFEFGTVDDWALKESRRQLVRTLQEEGHWRPLVTYSRTRDAQGRNVDVRFRILAGRRAKLVAVEFEGADPVPVSELAAATRTAPSGLLRARPFVSEWWEEDLRAVATLFRRHGFASATVETAEVRADAARGGLVATMRVEPGPRTLLDAVEIELAGGDPTPGIDVTEIAARLEQQTGGPFDAGGVRRDVDRLRALLADRGYPRAAVAQRTERLPAGARVTYRLVPGERVRVDRVLIGGNRSTDDEVIRRELAFLPGSAYSLSDLLETQTRLYRLGLFSQVDVAPATPDALDARRSMVVRVREAPPVFVTYGAGFDTEEKVRGTLAIGHNNIGGRNRQITLSTRASLREQRVRLLLREPYLFGRPQEATASAFYTDEDKASFDVRRIGASAQVLFTHGPDTASIGRYTFRLVDTFDIRIDPALIRREDQSTRVGSLGYILVNDTREDPIDPRTGGYRTVDLEVSARGLGGQTDFVTLFGRSFSYHRLSRALTLAVGARAGVKIPFAGSESVPLPERFFAGGSTTIRGFALDQAGPVDAGGNALGGEALLVANLELRAALRGPLGLVGFVDVGNVFATPGAVSWSTMRETAGVGIRYDTAVGPIRLDVARLLDRRPGEDRYQLFFSVGHTF